MEVGGVEVGDVEEEDVEEGDAVSKLGHLPPFTDSDDSNQAEGEVNRVVPASESDSREDPSS